MSAKVLMVQGAMSSVGKSLMVAALCRIFKQDRWRVAPFKAQNMALNSFATRDGREVGRAQAMQADAAGVDVTVEMNPVLIKPEADSFAQIVVLGKPWARLAAGEYMSRRGELWDIVTHALDSLRAQYDLIIIEGAGSPAELNLRRGDIVNMAIAEYAQAPVLLVGDIDRGGIFAQLLGTLWLLEEHERALVRGLIVNKFRGDARLFDDGVKILEARSGIGVLGVVPFVRDLRIADEDSVALETANRGSRSTLGIDVAVIRLPHISNFDDFDPLRAERDVTVRFVDRVEDIGQPDLLILPGTKTTAADLRYLRERGLTSRIVELAHTGVPVLGICGGYQMLGETIRDPSGVESDELEMKGLGLLPVTTTFAAEKQTTRARGCIQAERGLFANACGLEVTGYEIHMGRTSGQPQARSTPLLRVLARGEEDAADVDGAVSEDGMVAGTYFHGLFENDTLRHVLLANLAARNGRTRATAPARFDRNAEYDRLAETVRAHLDLGEVLRILGATP
ncbi:MAG: cobyric acid synthase [Chloroflexi bacterium]|nr:cobyric acid synthase [Chloroflexota bacterium]